MSSIRQARQAGFTLIELIVVIVILGILAATALPKFADLGADARKSSIKAAKGAIESGSAMAHGKFLVAGGTVTMDGATITMANGYPDNASSGIQAAAGGLSDFTAITTTPASPATGPTITTAATQIAFSPAGVTDTGKCYVLYTEAATGGAPTITSDTSDCK